MNIEQDIQAKGLTAPRITPAEAATDIIDVARAAGVRLLSYSEEYLSGLERLVAAAVAAEREACARVCDDEALRCEAAVQRAEPDEVSAIRSTAWKISVCAAAIRARGEK